jgi:hypothetical protein
MKQIPLSKISIASPCTAAWDDMEGDDTTRFCGQCSKYVYNLSEMAEADAQALVDEREGKICARFYQRPDGTMLTDDCPVGVSAARKRIALISGGVAGAVLFAIVGFLTVGAVLAGGEENNHRGRRPAGWNPIARVRDWFFPPQPMVMGEICPIVAPPPLPAPAPEIEK